MIHTKDDEIELVKNNLAVFDDKLPQKYVDLLLKKDLRINQHGLFFSLCNPHIYPHLLKALELIKSYDEPNFFPKAINKLAKAFNHIGQQAAVAEIVVVGYYCKKFLNHKQINVRWERVIAGSGKKMDVSLIGGGLPINIEVTAKDKDKRMRDFFDLRYKVKVAIQQKIATLPDQRFCYFFSIFAREEKKSLVSDFSEEHIEQFGKFIVDVRRKGVGKYYFIVDEVRLAAVEVRRLNKAKKEYAAQMDMWSGFMKDEKRMRNRIVDKARDQLPRNEINFVYIPNLANLDDIDFQEAFLGKEHWHLNKKGQVLGMTRGQGGAVTIIRDNKFSPVYGLIYSEWDYSKKKLVKNPLTNCEKSVLDLIE